MAQKLVSAGLTTRGILSQPLHFHRPWLFSPRTSGFGAARIQLPKKFGRVVVANSRSSRPHGDEPSVLLSSKDLPDGSILFRFGSPDQKITESVAEPELTSENGAATSPDSHELGQAMAISVDAQGSPVLTEEPTASGAGNESVSRDGPSNADSPLDDGVAPSNATLMQDKELSSHTNNATSLSHQSEIEKVPSTDVHSIEDAHCNTTYVKEGSDLQKEEKSAKALKLCSGAAMQPHPSKAASGGEDAYFIEGTSWVGVADGVGGWALSGINSGLFSRELMSNCAALAKQENGVPDPKSVIIRGVKKATALGTCTAVVAALHDQTLYIANIGDSGFILVRNGEVFAKSHPMQRGFNFPYQIGSEGDDPAMAETFELKANAGDVLILATDGIFDNIYEATIVGVVRAGQAKNSKPEEVAMHLVEDAHAVGKSTTARSPFSDAAIGAGYSYTGGKLDDATVVVSYVE